MSEQLIYIEKEKWFKFQKQWQQDIKNKEKDKKEIYEQIGLKKYSPSCRDIFSILIENAENNIKPQNFTYENIFSETNVSKDSTQVFIITDEKKWVFTKLKYCL